MEGMKCVRAQRWGRKADDVSQSHSKVGDRNKNGTDAHADTRTAQHEDTELLSAKRSGESKLPCDFSVCVFDSSD